MILEILKTIGIVYVVLFFTTILVSLLSYWAINSRYSSISELLSNNKLASLIWILLFLLWSAGAIIGLLIAVYTYQ